MNLSFFSTPTGIAVIAAGSSFLAGLLGASVSSWTIHRTQSQRLRADERLAEQKAAADIALAKQKFDYDRELHVRKRRVELAESLLSDAYRFRELMHFARSNVVLNGDGESRQAAVGETDNVRRSRNTYYIPIERLQSQNEFLGKFFAKKSMAAAYYGDRVNAAFNKFDDSIIDIRASAEGLMGQAEFEETNQNRMIEARQTIWAGLARSYGQEDILAKKIDAGVSLFEEFCRPDLEWTGA